MTWDEGHWRENEGEEKIRMNELIMRNLNRQEEEHQTEDKEKKDNT